MRIVCPGCKTQYDVPEAMLAGGTRTVRCARCASEWTPPANAAPPPARDDFDASFAHDMDGQYGEAKDRARAADDVADDGVDFSMTGMRARMMHEPGPRPALAAPGGRRRGAAVVAVAAWALSVLVVAGGVYAAVTWRTEVMAAWPPSERAYAAVGLR